MKKLLIVTDAWFPQVNGVVTVFDRVSKLLGEHGIEVSIAHPELFKWRFPLPLYPEVPLVLFPNSEMRNIFIREKPDYVHVATEWTLGLSARKICLDNNIPFTTSYHTNFPLYAAHYFRFGYLLAPFASTYMRWFHAAAQTMLVSTPSLCAQLISEGFKNVRVWPFGIDTDFFKKSDRVPEDVAGLARPVFLYFGRVGKEKGVEEFLRLDLPGTKLVVGDGPLKKPLEQKYRTARFVGYKRGQDLVDYISVADVFVFPSRTETFGLAVLEALSCGVPVAAHDVLGPRDTITHGVDGFLSEDLKDAALKCLEFSKEDCRKKALRYSWENSAEVFLHYVQGAPMAVPESLRRTRAKRIMNTLTGTFT